MGELEVTAFTAYFRADQCLCALLALREIGGRAITLNQAQVFMEGRTADTRP